MVTNLQDISCKNTACVSHPQNMQHEVEPFFERCRQCGLGRTLTSLPLQEKHCRVACVKKSWKGH